MNEKEKNPYCYLLITNMLLALWIHTENFNWIEDTLMENCVPNREGFISSFYNFILVFDPYIQFVSCWCCFYCWLLRSVWFRRSSVLRHWFECICAIYGWMFIFAFKTFRFFSRSTTWNFRRIVFVCSICCRIFSNFSVSLFLLCIQEQISIEMKCGLLPYFIRLFGALLSIPFGIQMVQWCKI